MQACADSHARWRRPAVTLAPPEDGLEIAPVSIADAHAQLAADHSIVGRAMCDAWTAEVDRWLAPARRTLGDWRGTSEPSAAIAHPV